MKKAILLVIVTALFGCGEDKKAVTPSSNQLVANNDTVETHLNQTVTINVKENDSSAYIPISHVDVIGISNVTSGTAAIVGNNKVEFVPDSGFIGTATFDYTLEDSEKNRARATVSVSVTENQNIPPVAAADYLTVAMGQSASINVLDNDHDTDGFIQGTFEVADSTLGEILVDGLSVRFTGGYSSGSEVVDYTIWDNKGASATGKLHLSVNEITTPLAKMDNVSFRDTTFTHIKPFENSDAFNGYSIKNVSNDHDDLNVRLVDDQTIEIKTDGIDYVGARYSFKYIMQSPENEVLEGIVYVTMFSELQPMAPISLQEISVGNLKNDSISRIYSSGADVFHFGSSRVVDDANGDEFDDIQIAIHNAEAGGYPKVSGNLLLFGNEEQFESQLDVLDYFTNHPPRSNSQFNYINRNDYYAVGENSRSDLNNDGLADYIQYSSEGPKIQFGEISDDNLNNITSDLITLGTNNSYYTEYDFSDVNGDGTTDLLLFSNETFHPTRHIKTYYGPITKEDTDLFSRPFTKEVGTEILFSQNNVITNLGYKLKVFEGDLNSDGKRDVVFGDYTAQDASGAQTGQISIIWNVDALPVSVNTQDLSADLQYTRVTIDGDTGLTMGHLVNSSDINGDGQPELIIGLTKQERYNIEAFSEIHILSTNGEWPTELNLSDLPSNITSYRIFSSERNGRIHHVVPVDINGDHYTDLLINDGNQQTVLLGGTQDRPMQIDLENITWPHATFYSHPYKVSSANLNNDEYEDLVISAPMRQGESNQQRQETFVIYGGPQFRVP